MWEQLGFESDDSDIPNQSIYWNNIIPSDYTLLNKSGITIEDGDNPANGSKTPRILYGNFLEEIDVENLYGVATSPITNLDEVDENLILNVDFDQTTTDDLIDKTNLSKIEYNQDFEVSLDDDLRLKIESLIIPDGIEKNKNEQAF